MEICLSFSPISNKSNWRITQRSKFCLFFSLSGCFVALLSSVHLFSSANKRIFISHYMLSALVLLHLCGLTIRCAAARLQRYIIFVDLSSFSWLFVWGLLSQREKNGAHRWKLKLSHPTCEIEYVKRTNHALSIFYAWTIFWLHLSKICAEERQVRNLWFLKMM